jgi:XRE family transcriptional regulator, aerobic/anaerobic benzoate catabolism transcriptional regulator
MKAGEFPKVGTDAAASAAPDREFLGELGQRVRRMRALRGMSRKALAVASGVSERYLAQLESGDGNLSIVLLRRVARATGAPIEDLVSDEPLPGQWPLLRDLLHVAKPDAIKAAIAALRGEAPDAAPDRITRAIGRIALIGLRGAGKSTLGRGLAAVLEVPFVELDREIEREGGTQLATIFDLYGQPGFRRFEREALERTLQRDGRFVLEAGGGIVAEPMTFARLRATCFTVWIRASAAEHMSRVLAQGDTRPMGGADAMADLQRILASRETLYGEADATLDTSGRTAAESAADLLALLPAA